MGTEQSKALALREMQELFGQVPSWVADMPDNALPGLWSVMRDLQFGETKIPNKYKALIGLAVSSALRCQYGVLFHTEAARLWGASDDEIAEAGTMAGMTAFASTFLNARQTDYESYRREVLDIVKNVKQQRLAKGGPLPVGHA